MSDHPTEAFKIIDATDWTAAQASGEYAGAPIDLKDGFIHLSTQAQLAETAARHFAGRTGLMLLKVDLTALGDTVVWEPSRGGDLFPHIYGPLPVAAVIEAGSFESSPIGTGGQRRGGGGSPHTPASGEN